jgi:hypothetical protein
MEVESREDERGVVAALTHCANRPSFGIKRLALDHPEGGDDLPTCKSHKKRRLGVDGVQDLGAGKGAESRCS